MRRRLRFLFLLLLAILLIIGYTYVKDPKVWPIRHVQITTQLQHVEPTMIQDIVSRYVQDSFFMLSSKALRKDLQALPWVEQVDITRVWPDTLQLSVIERVPIARWTGTALISTKGELFDPKAWHASELPQLTGEDAYYQTMLAVFNHANTELSAVGLQVVALELSPRLAWSMQLDNGLELYLGQEELKKRLARLVGVWDRLDLKHPESTYIDLRYTNGFVVGDKS